MSGILQAARRMSFGGQTGNAPSTCDFIAGANGWQGTGSASIGPAAVDRYVFAFLLGFRGGSLTLMSATIGGVSAKIHDQQQSNYFSSAYINMALISAPLPSGETAAIGSAYNNSASSTVAYIYRVTGLVSNTVRSIYTYNTGGDDNWSTNMDVATDGFTLAGYAGYGHPSRVLDTAQMTKDFTNGSSNDKYMSWSNLEDANNENKSFSWSTTSAPSVTNSGPFIAASFR